MLGAVHRNTLRGVVGATDVNRLGAIIQSGSPSARKIGAPLQEWSNASQSFQVSPTARNVARLTIASRNLSNNLADVGIQVSADKLAMSEDEQQQQLDAYIQRKYGEQ